MDPSEHPPATPASSREIDSPVLPEAADTIYRARPVHVGPGAPADYPPATEAAWHERPRHDPFSLAAHSRRDAALDAILLLAITFGFPVAHSIIEATQHPPTPEQLEAAVETALSLPTKAFEALIVVTLAAYLLLRHRLTAASFGLTVRRLPLQIVLGVAGFFVAIGYTLFTAMAMSPFLEGLESDVEKRLDMFEALPTENLPYAAVLLVPVVIHEELLFRGMLLPLLRRATGRWWIAVVASSAVFALLHLIQGVVGAVQIFGLSVVLSILFILSRSVLATMIAHHLFNFAQFGLIRWMFENGPIPPPA